MQPFRLRVQRYYKFFILQTFLQLFLKKVHFFWKNTLKTPFLTPKTPHQALKNQKQQPKTSTTKVQFFDDIFKKISIFHAPLRFFRRFLQKITSQHLEFGKKTAVQITLDYPSSAVKYYSPPILLIYIALGCCVVKRLFVQK